MFFKVIEGFLWYLFIIWLHWVLVVACGILNLHCSRQDLCLWHGDSSFLTSEQTQSPALGEQSLCHGSPGKWQKFQNWRIFLRFTSSFYRLPRWLSGRESTCQCRRCRFDPWVGKIPWRRKWKPPPVFLPGEFHGQRSLVGYSPWGRNRVRHGLATKQQLHFDKVEKQGLECVWGMRGRGRGRWGEKKHTVEKAKMNFKGSWLYLCTNSIFIEYLW